MARQTFNLIGDTQMELVNEYNVVYEERVLDFTGGNKQMLVTNNTQSYCK